MLMIAFLQKALPLNITETLNSSIFTSSLLTFVQLGVLHFLVTTQAYLQSAKRKKLLIDGNQYQENITSSGVQLHISKHFWESCFILSVNYTGQQPKECFTIQAKASNLEHFNSFMTEAVIVQKPVNCFAEKINWVVSIW